jgi:hypothetical protein
MAKPVHWSDRSVHAAALYPDLFNRDEDAKAGIKPKRPKVDPNIARQWRSPLGGCATESKPQPRKR